MHLQRVPGDDKDYLMYCPQKGCGVTQTEFLMSGTKVQVRSMASALPMVAVWNGKSYEFQDFDRKKPNAVRSVQCAKCKTTYNPEDAHTTN